MLIIINRRKTVYFINIFFFKGFELSHCEDPGVPQFGYKISDQGHFAGSTIIYGCNPGYTLHGSSLLKCMTGERRAWDYPLPSCIGKKCFTFFFLFFIHCHLALHFFYFLKYDVKYDVYHKQIL